MSEINNLLAKHFSKETSEAEEKLIEVFRRENTEEYHTLMKLWNSEGIIVYDFDDKKAWKSITNQANKTPARTKTSKRLKYAVIVLGLILLAFFGKKYLQPNEVAPQMIVQLGSENQEAIKLADGSIVHLNKNAKLTYPKVFTGKNRTVRLDGEAYFDIARDETRRFTVSTHHSEVKVLGTSFNINTTENNTQVAVTSGKVEVAARHSEESAVLIKNQAAFVSEKEFDSYNLEDQNFLAWKTGNFSFDDEPISNVITSLNSYYENKITLLKKDSDCLLTANFNKDKIAEIMEIIELTCNLSAHKKNASYELY